MSVKVASPFSPDGVQCLPKLFTISAPAGAGKTTLVHMLQEEFPSAFEKTVSSTTRSPRPGEVHGVDYVFMSEDEFKDVLDKDGFLEWVFLFGTYYGTSKEGISRILQKGKHCIAVIDVQGALTLKKQMQTVAIFIQAPSQEELERRLNTRDSEKDLQKKERLEHSNVEIAAASQFDYVVVNDDLTTAYQVLRSIFIAEEHRMSHG
ncbi:guanylate kinase [Chlamydia muridarum str. Nigg]|jgi:guanylate kinase|uniref:Guanylate kinase n=2 Tax=Chlamydia muridarum TaxID=83560 RepID=KGUA_CHLMU|nr:guanylate kinase [Chlamydia muridarum]Q9PL09.1 RecName: Full=Guanylate kinase; AltName: Full=GMP kinase [Chlamydia muridarum str. Nigg]UFW32845.1 guanylate kinase [Chlamydia trachomatis]AAF39164.1 guanylate kinase [Chlamydia muridarum str. Nigg]AHH22689.1 guanylate kinase [Chlamydia muridarum str. Nigg3 CMUT3-5]AHH23613.1 guanylate kinase [Chlamydia muridarum str. Nigg CM972]AID37834.1 guanylate kinase [Chlamydia muridarum str. Nigg 2 MCR]